MNIRQFTKNSIYITLGAEPQLRLLRLRLLLLAGAVALSEAQALQGGTSLYIAKELEGALAERDQKIKALEEAE